jgi:hypothetical protein
MEAPEMNLRTRIAITLAARHENRTLTYMLATWRNTHPSANA